MVRVRVRVRLWIVWHMDEQTAAGSALGRRWGTEVALYAKGTALHAAVASIKWTFCDHLCIDIAYPPEVCYPSDTLALVLTTGYTVCGHDSINTHMPLS